MKTARLIKGHELFQINYEVGMENIALDALVEMVNCRELSFDWFDAAILSHQIGAELAKELKTYLPKK